MAEVYNLEKAKSTFATLCKTLDNMEWHYQMDEERLLIKSGVQGEDLPIEFIVRVNPDNEIVSYHSLLPFKISEEKRIDGAIAVCAANYGLVDGSFDYDISDGEIIFRLTSSFRGSVLSEELFEYMISVASSTVDGYNDKFFMISKGVMTVQQFLESENKRKSNN